MGAQYPGGVAFRLALDGKLDILHNFNAELPNSLILGQDGILYGTTSGDIRSTYTGSGNYTTGYVSGTFFSLAPGGGTPTVLHSFYGYYVRPGLVQGADGKFYGALYPNGSGTASLQIGSYSAVLTAAVFSATATGTVTLSSSPTTSNGLSTIGTGTITVPVYPVFPINPVFPIDPVVPIAPVTPSLPIIGEPNGDLVQAGDGAFYGTSVSSSNATLSGSVFRYTPADGKWSGLFNFPITQKDGTNPAGASPQGGLALGSDGFIYGTTAHGGAHGLGTIFRLGIDGTLVTVYSFTGAEDGSKPAAGLVADGNGGFYGSTSLLSDGTAAPASQKYRGTIFRFTPMTGAFSTVHGFASSEGANPAGAPILGGDGLLYGVTTNGGAYGGGAIFSVSLNGEMVTRYSFKDHGAYPHGLILGRDGNFYGANNREIFRFTPDGVFSTVGAVATDDRMFANVIQGSDGNFYGTTVPNDVIYGTTFSNDSGAIYDELNPQNISGSVFMMTPGGTLTTLHRFAGNGSETNPTAGVIEGSDGDFYGTTANTVFKVTPAGELTRLATFKLKAGGISPRGVFLGSDGNIHGTYANRGGRFVAYSISPRRRIDQRSQIDRRDYSHPLWLPRLFEHRRFGFDPGRRRIVLRDELCGWPRYGRDRFPHDADG